MGPHVVQSAQMVLSPVLLFDVGEDLNVFGSDLFAISQQLSSAGVHEAFVSHVREDKTLGPDEIQTCGRTAESLQLCGYSSASSAGFRFRELLRLEGDWFDGVSVFVFWC